MEQACAYCGKLYQVRPFRAETQRFCSSECKHAANRVTLVCPQCGKEFWTWKSQVDPKRDRRFCCKVCADTSRRKVGEGKPRRIRPPHVIKTCEFCAKAFSVIPSRKDSARFCSVSCKSASPEYRQGNSERQSAEKHWRWAGGKYHNHHGYVRLKRKRLGNETVRLEHTDIILKWMIEEAADHPFLIVVDGLVKLHPDIEVHHIDRRRANNVRSNLLAVTKQAHAQIHHRGKKPEPWECWPSHPERW